MRLTQSDIRGLALIEQFKTSNFYDTLDDVCPELITSQPGKLQSHRFPRLKWVIGLRGAKHPGMLAWNDLASAGKTIQSTELTNIERQLNPGDPINLQYTSGTTGTPKGAWLTHRNLLLNGFYAGECQRLNETDRICIPVPLYHCFGCVLGSMSP